MAKLMQQDVEVVEKSHWGGVLVYAVVIDGKEGSGETIRSSIFNQTDLEKFRRPRLTAR